MYKADEIQFPRIPGNRGWRRGTDKDNEKYEDGFFNPDLIRLHVICDPPHEFPSEENGYSVPFYPYEQTPQAELKSREFYGCISGGKSYRVTQMFNHDEESTYSEIP